MWHLERGRVTGLSSRCHYLLKQLDVLNFFTLVFVNFSKPLERNICSTEYYFKCFQLCAYKAKIGESKPEKQHMQTLELRFLEKNCFIFKIIILHLSLSFPLFKPPIYSFSLFIFMVSLFNSFVAYICMCMHTYLYLYVYVHVYAHTYIILNTWVLHSLYSVCYLYIYFQC